MKKNQNILYVTFYYLCHPSYPSSLFSYSHKFVIDFMFKASKIFSKYYKVFNENFLFVPKKHLANSKIYILKIEVRTLR